MDQNILFLINHDWTNASLDRVMAVASCFDLWKPFLVLGVLAIAICGRFHARAMLLVFAVSLGVSDGIMVNGLKHLVGRPRPYEAVAGVRSLDVAFAKPRILAIGRPLREQYSKPAAVPHRGSSFPSGHASNNFAFATVVFLFYRRWGWLAYLPALMVAYSRVYVGAHWPSDVLLSCLLGVVVSLVVAALMETGWRKYGDRLLPALNLRHPSLIEA